MPSGALASPQDSVSSKRKRNSEEWDLWDSDEDSDATTDYVGMHGDEAQPLQEPASPQGCDDFEELDNQVWDFETRANYVVGVDLILGYDDIMNAVYLGHIKPMFPSPPDPVIRPEPPIFRRARGYKFVPLDYDGPPQEFYVRTGKPVRVRFNPVSNLFRTIWNINYNFVG
jgi:hypothetical protein